MNDNFISLRTQKNLFKDHGYETITSQTTELITSNMTNDNHMLCIYSLPNRCIIAEGTNILYQDGISPIGINYYDIDNIFDSIFR